MIVTIPAPNWPPNGPRPINLKQDVPQVVELLELAFGEKMDQGGRSIVRHGSMTNQPDFLWRFHPRYNRLAPGYIWQEGDRIVGNVTLIATKVPGRHIVANVAVHPDYRRRGIARALMDAVMNQVRARHGNVVMLQVVKDNYPAIDLYRSLNFHKIGSMALWRGSLSRLREIPAAREGSKPPVIRPLSRRQWQEAYQLDVDCLHPDLNWPEPLPSGFYRTGFMQSVSNFMNGRQQEMWGIVDDNGRLVGVGSLVGEWLQSYELSVRVHPQWRGHLERPLLAKLVRRVRTMSRRNVRINHPDHDEVMSDLLEQANFSIQRTLTHMRWDVTYDRSVI
ncbi:MAG: GNAT family N-acetyltransferase [Anaerolineales bacterium]|nr:GNAT family N-acetyltransferase [Anaerolineales bacterium]MCA9975683.1 GNAT family N-acetyltransferase [Anaerolineales bacterium]MCB8967464.1 GNAT family N-acetyltransferase [Ardenticatenaceae bacterium]